jgi:hypothetical protein
MNSSYPPIYGSRRRLEDLRELRRTARRDLWQGRVLSFVALVMLLTVLGAILWRTWPVEMLQLLERVEQAAAPVISEARRWGGL